MEIGASYVAAAKNSIWLAHLKIMLHHHSLSLLQICIPPTDCLVNGVKALPKSYANGGMGSRVKAKECLDPFLGKIIARNGNIHLDEIIFTS